MSLITRYHQPDPRRPSTDCHCPLCAGGAGRLLAWLDSQPGPWLTTLTWILAGLFLGWLLWR